MSRKLKTVVLIALLVAGGCATPVPHHWPPESGTSTKTIYVSLDTWHAMIGFPREGLAADPGNTTGPRTSLPSSTQAKFEEWGYAEREWYLEGRQGVSGILRAMGTDSEGTVEIAEYDRLWAERTPQPPADLFTFQLSEEGYHALRSHLRSTIASTMPVARRGSSRFYLASQPYSFSHHCHHYVALALQEAGLPVESFWGLTRTSLATQLQEAETLVKEATSQGTFLRPFAP